MTMLPGGPALEARGDDELAEERDFLLGSLTDLEAEREAGDVDPDDYTALKDSYTARAAAVLRELDHRRVGAALAARPDVGPADGAGARRRDTTVEVVGTSPRRRRRWLAGGIVAGVVVFAAVAGALVMVSAGQRLPGDNPTGATPTSPSAKLLAQAQDDIQKSDYLGAVKTYDQVLKLDPQNAEALAYEGWLLRLIGSSASPPNGQLIDRGLGMLHQAVAAKPSYADPHFFLGLTLLQDKNDPAGAIREFQQFLAANPPPSMVPAVQGELQVAQNALAGRAGGMSTAPTPPPSAPTTTAP